MLLDASAFGTTTSSTGTVTKSITSSGTGSRVAVAIVLARPAGGKTTTDTITCTYAGTSMTLLKSGNDGSGPGTTYAVFVLGNPATGTQNVIATDSTDATVTMNVTAWVFTGALVPPVAQVADSRQVSTTFAVQSPVTPGVNDYVVYMAGCDSAGAGWTNNSGLSTGQIQTGVDDTGANLDVCAGHRPGSAGVAPMSQTLTIGNVQNVTVTIQPLPTTASKVGSFICPVAVGNQAVTGVGFQPKAVLFWSNPLSADGGTGGSSLDQLLATLLMGMTDGVTQAALLNSDDFSAGDPMVTTAYCIAIYHGTAGTPILSATIVSLDADGFTVNWDNVTSGAIINYMALGGTDITGAKVVIPTVTGGVTGNRGVTGVGFQPDAVVLGVSDTIIPNNNTTGSLGFFTAIDQCAVSSEFVAGVIDYQLTDHCVLAPQNQSGGTMWRASRTSLDVDGFTLNWDVVGTGTLHMAALCLKGPSFKVGAFNTPTTTGNTPAVSGLAFAPNTLLLASDGLPASGVIQTPASPGLQYIIAGSDGTSQSVVSYSSGNNGVHSVDRTHIYRRNPDASGVATPDILGALTTFNSGGFSVNWTTAPATAPQVLYLAIGLGTGVTTPSPIAIYPPQFIYFRRNNR